MSWTTDKATVTAVMTGYTEVKNILDAEKFPQANEHKGYSLRPERSDNGANLTSSGLITSDVAVLEISYRNTENADVDANYDLFIAVQDAISALSGFYGWVERSFGRMKTKNYCSKGILRFYLGIRSC